ncbi:FecR family protein [Celeribacter indicus]|uniref:Protein fecR n=1 Tax=Celeribacter indicus TaxID=1208324 RepID=A0A0B5DQK7_9RHOB|nr:FecR domain-containing protein [Celeribacter indicus]AJE45813.1 protein fecR [Celeribacter indicus]SDW61278.1 FecR family protein [Celeribacter indicus]
MSDQRSSEPPLLSGAEIEEQAIDWLMRLREAPTDPDLRAAHERWLGDDPHRADAWSLACRSWDMLGTREAWPATPAPVPPAPKRHASRLGVRLAGGMALAAVLMLALLFGPELTMRLRADYMTRPGEIQHLTLSDGSRVTLAAGSAVALEFSGARRGVTLLEGTAFFEVAHDPARPFVVSTRTLEARAIGTAFEVDRMGASASVSVTEGSVGLDGLSGTGAKAVLQAGDWQRLEADGTLSQGSGDPATFAEWREGKLFVEDRPALEVAERLQREAGGTVILIGGARDRRVTGYFDLSSPEEALRTFAASLDLVVRRVGSLRLIYGAT